MRIIKEYVYPVINLDDESKDFLLKLNKYKKESKMRKLELLKNELLGKKVTIQEMEDTVGFIFDFDDKDSIFNENVYLAFENMSHSYEMLTNDFENETWLNISFKADTNDDTDFDIYEDKILITEIEYIK